MSKTTINKTEWSSSRQLEILIVDDDKVIHLLHSKCIKTFHIGYPVSTFENGKQALEYINQKNQPQQYFLVLLDLNMPVMNGWEFLEACQTNNLERVFTVVVTSSIKVQDRFTMFDFPQVIAYCEKPFSKINMKEILELKELAPFPKLRQEKLQDNFYGTRASSQATPEKI